MERGSEFREAVVAPSCRAQTVGTVCTVCMQCIWVGGRVFLTTGREGEWGNLQYRRHRAARICPLWLQCDGKRTRITCSFVLPTLPIGVYVSRLPTLPLSPVADPYHEKRCSRFRQHTKAYPTTAVHLSLCSFVLYAAGWRW